MNESTFKTFVYQRLETYFPCENPESVFKSMLDLAKEQYPENTQDQWTDWLIESLVKENKDYTLDFFYYSFKAKSQQESLQAA